MRSRRERPRSPRSGAAAALAAGLLLLAGCGGRPASEAAIHATCARAGDLCRMGGSKLGVCTASAEGALACQDQH